MNEKTCQASIEEESVYFCKGCLSLRVKTMHNGVEYVDYCDSCGSTSIHKAPFDVYARICKRAGKKLVERK